MAKDPAFLFYSGDFLTGVQFLTHEQRGKYITLLCMQHQQGHLKEKHMLMVCNEQDTEVFEKFAKDNDGLYYQPRLELEMTRRANYNAGRRQNLQGHNAPAQQNKKKAPPGTTTAAKSKATAKQRIKTEDPDPIQKQDAVRYPFESSNFKKLWRQWKEYKRREHGFEYASAQSEQAILKKLATMSGGREQAAMEIIAESMANGWKGLFELANNNNNAGRNNDSGQRNPGVMQAIYDIIGDTSGCF